MRPPLLRLRRRLRVSAAALQVIGYWLWVMGCDRYAAVGVVQAVPQAALRLYVMRCYKGHKNLSQYSLEEAAYS